MYKQSLSVAVLASVVFLAGQSGAALAAPTKSASASVPKRASLVRVPQGSVQVQKSKFTEKFVDPRLRTAKGKVDVWVTLDQPSVAQARVAAAAASGIESSARGISSAVASSMKSAGSTQRAIVRSQQQSVSRSLSGLGARELARVQVVHNSIAVRVDASRISEIAAIPGVSKVRLVEHAQLDLSETVPYVGAKAVQDLGIDGKGVRVAVLDSGVDYTHRNLGGEGTLEAYEAAYGVDPTDARNTTRDGLFPTAKVVEGIDFVGETWGVNAAGDEVGVRTTDPDPIDFGGHGTHVADIIAGKSTDGLHVGVAPGASLISVKVCSAISTACNGEAILLGLEYAVDPNGDGDTSDAVDLINMSLGSDYGREESVNAEAAANVVALGTMLVASAGNGGNRPFIQGSPSRADAVLAVAQTEVPSAEAIALVVNAPATIAGTYSNTQTVEWAPVDHAVTGDVAFIGRGCPADSVAPGSPADPLLSNPAGKVALIDRGACSVSLKVDYAAKAGATAVLIGLVAAGDAVSFSYGGGDTFVPTMVIQQSLSTAIKGRLTAAQVVNVTISPDSAIPLVGGVASTSSRGPTFNTNTIKPEIGAPGASLSAEVGTGEGETAFGGTSGAAPMVTGAAALLMQAYPNRSVMQLKAMLMNSAETALYTNPALLPGQLAPITRVGAGELRVDRALALTAIAWNRDTKSAALSFGAREVANPMTLTRRLRIENFDKLAQTFSIDTSFRFANDEASGAVQVSAPSSVSVGGKRVKEITVTMTIDPTKLPAWTLNGGFGGNNGAALNGPEYDGFVTLTSGNQTLSVPWHVLPRKAASTSLKASRVQGQDVLNLSNAGLNTGEFDFFSFMAKSPRIPKSELPGPGDGIAVVDINQVGVRHLTAEVFGDDYLEFAITQFERLSHPISVEYDIYIDTNGDGDPDYVVFNGDVGTVTAGVLSGQSGVFVFNLTSGALAIYFYADTDFNSRNMIMTVPMGALGLVPGATINFDVYAFDNHFTGFLTDAVTGMRFTPGSPRYSIGDVPFGEVGAGETLEVPLVKAKVSKSLSSETGALLLYRRNTPTESQQIVRGQ